MIRKISIFFFLPMLIIALLLALNGVTHLEYGEQYYSFLRNVSMAFNNWKFDIPDVPKISLLVKESAPEKQTIIDILKSIVNFFINIVNAFITTLNITIMVANVFIHVIQFIITLVNEVRNFLTNNSSVVFVQLGLLTVS